ncbi:MAG: hypothetical protein KDB03_15630, partial [Planctomycetales bacterium]|nr:hypothetical protein [Planctomycetales bacterium]
MRALCLMLILFVRSGIFAQEKSRDGFPVVGPDPNNLSRLVELLDSKPIQLELELQEEQLQSITILETDYQKRLVSILQKMFRKEPGSQHELKSF